MTDNPCTAFIENEHSGGTHHCVLNAGHRDPEFGTDHAGPVDDEAGRYRWSDHAIGAVPHQDPTPAVESDAEPSLVHVGWWCWRGDNHGHLATMACRSDNVPIHVPADWADEMRAVIQRIEDGDDEEQPAAGGVVSAAPDRADLRQRIAEALARLDAEKWGVEIPPKDHPFWQIYPTQADAVLAVLPPPADRAAVLRWAADVLDAGMERFFTEWPDEPRNSPYALGKKDAADELRRVAAEAQQQEAGRSDVGTEFVRQADQPDEPGFVPPAAENLPLGALDSATAGASALDAWARTPRGRNFLAHALVQLARDGWLRAEPGEGWEPVRERDDVPEPQDPAVSGPRAADGKQDGEAPIVEPHCDGFPTACPNPVTVPPAPPHHGGGFRCGCYDEERKS